MGNEHDEDRIDEWSTREDTSLKKHLCREEKQLHLCLMVSVVSTVLSVVAVIIYSIDMDKNPEVPCVKTVQDSCSEKHYAMKLSRGMKSSLLLFTLAQTVISAIVCFLLFRQRNSFGQYTECFGPSSVRVAPAVSMFPRQNPACLCALGAVFLLVSGEEVSESRSGMIQELRSALADLAGEGKTYLGRLAGEQTVLSVQKAFSQVLGVVAEGLASGLNVLLQHVSHLLQAAGVQVVFPINRVTPEGLLFLAQWVLVALIGYWLVSFAFCLVASTLRRAVWLLKVGVALACFGFILRDHSVGTETLAVRLAVLVCACVLLGVGTSKGPDAADKTAHLEEQVRILERRLREMEKWTKAE
ncbi:hypothetical protein F2P81_010837 [Scophthalmus maximus]|uniref:Transmembrane protein 109 n=1 Tax=Scophthalmus maximus TaxID=52904 RepID=A0A6A4SVI1_SCOMX|nr:hypothetical protein F2P81_010837 [Scophthalmus maximus]